MLQSMGLQRIRHDLATEHQQQSTVAQTFHLSFLSSKLLLFLTFKWWSILGFDWMSSVSCLYLPLRWPHHLSFKQLCLLCLPHMCLQPSLSPALKVRTSNHPPDPSLVCLTGIIHEWRRVDSRPQPSSAWLKTALAFHLLLDNRTFSHVLQSMSLQILEVLSSKIYPESKLNC